MSFSDRYQGTEWGQPVPEAPGAPPPAPRRRGLLSRVLALVAVLVIVGGVAAGGWFLTRQPGAAAPSASPAPSATLPPSAALRAYLKLINKPFTGHLKFAYIVDSAGTDIDMRADMDVSGDDMKGRVRLKEGSRTLVFDLIQKSGRQYARLPGGEWRRLPANAETETANPFDALAAENAIVDRGVVERSGKSLHWLHMSELANADRVLKEWGLRGTVEDFSADIYVTAKGVPVDGSVKFNLSTQAGVTRFLMNFTISRFGRPVKITAPIR